MQVIYFSNILQSCFPITHHPYNTLIATFIGPTWGPSGADRTQGGPCWPHELCYLSRCPIAHRQSWDMGWPLHIHTKWYIKVSIGTLNHLDQVKWCIHISSTLDWYWCWLDFCLDQNQYLNQCCHITYHTHRDTVCNKICLENQTYPFNQIDLKNIISKIQPFQQQWVNCIHIKICIGISLFIIQQASCIDMRITINMDRLCWKAMVFVMHDTI